MAINKGEDRACCAKCPATTRTEEGPNSAWWVPRAFWKRQPEGPGTLEEDRAVPPHGASTRGHMSVPPPQMNFNHLGINSPEGRCASLAPREAAGDTGGAPLTAGLEGHAQERGWDPAGSEGRLRSSSREAPHSDPFRKVALAVAACPGGGGLEGRAARLREGSSWGGRRGEPPGVQTASSWSGLGTGYSGDPSSHPMTTGQAVSKVPGPAESSSRQEVSRTLSASEARHHCHKEAGKGPEPTQDLGMLLEGGRAEGAFGTDSREQNLGDRHRRGQSEKPVGSGGAHGAPSVGLMPFPQCMITPGPQPRKTPRASSPRATESAARWERILALLTEAPVL